MLYFQDQTQGNLFCGNFLHKTCSRHYIILAKTPSRMTTAITFSRQNEACSRVSKTQYWENLVLVVVLVSESKAP